MITRLLFPEEDVRRKYDMQETRLAGYLADCFGIRKDILVNWRGEDREGCLGVEVRKAIEERTVSLPHSATHLSNGLHRRQAMI